jgi:hypothetical protein
MKCYVQAYAGGERGETIEHEVRTTDEMKLYWFDLHSVDGDMPVSPTFEEFCEMWLKEPQTYPEYRWVDDDEEH